MLSFILPVSLACNTVTDLSLWLSAISSSNIRLNSAVGVSTNENTFQLKPGESAGRTMDFRDAGLRVSCTAFFF